MESESKELCLIDSGISSLADLALHSKLRILNLHCNQIRKIERLHLARNLRHLDLSSNQIKKIECLDYLGQLRTLNLSCNKIEVVEGLAGLHSLVKCNLSYNKIQDVGGFRQMSGSGYKLSHIELQGNLLKSVRHLTESLTPCSNLRNLVLTQSGSSNPVCQQQNCEQIVFSDLSQLHSLNGKDRAGRAVSDDNILADIPGLEDYMDYLRTSESSDNRSIPFVTPKIDAVLNVFRQVRTPEMNNSSYQSDLDSAGHLESSSPDRENVGTIDHEDRLKLLEHQLADLVKQKQDVRSSNSCSSLKSVEKRDCYSGEKPIFSAKRDVDETEESDSGDSPRHSIVAASSKQNIASGSRTNFNKRSEKNFKPSRIAQAKNVEAKSRRKPNITNNPNEGNSDFEKQQRKDLETTYVQLMQELEGERERRWKAEQAAKKLAERLQEEMARARADHEVQFAVENAAGKLKKSLMDERENRLKVQAELEILQGEMEAENKKCSKAEALVTELKRYLKGKEEMIEKVEQESRRQEAVLSKQVQESRMKAAAMGREVELVKSQVNNLKTQLQQMQELLASREQDHRRDKEGMFTIGSKEFQDFLSREVARTEKEKSHELQRQQEKIDALEKNYAELEDEFRLALHVEADRFKQLQVSYEQTSTENVQNKQALMAALEKEERSRNIISELNALVKEQKGRISELSKSKHEQTSEMKERILQLEAHLDEARRRMVQLEMLKQEKMKLQAENQALASLVEGTKSEKKLWGEELAHQSSSLAQDRGRLEAKIEGLQTELATTKKMLERETDVVKIKSKVIDDQNETVRKLKDAVLERDKQIKEARDEILRVQKELEEQLNVETTENQTLVEKLNQMQARKDELKDRVTELEDKLESSRAEYNKLSVEWKRKSQEIQTIEEQVQKIVAVREMKEKKLIEERDKSAEAARTAMDKLKAMDDSFRKQLDAKEQSHQKEFNDLLESKQAEVDAATRHVIEVEEEMRILLREVDVAKRTNEEKIKKLTRAFSELQQDFI